MTATDAVKSNGAIPDWMANSNNNTTKAPSEDGIASKETFLKLLVAQLRNQNPLDPADGVQFLSQLAQFTDLEETMRMREEISAIRGAIEQLTAKGEENGSGVNEIKEG